MRTTRSRWPAGLGLAMLLVADLGDFLARQRAAAPADARPAGIPPPDLPAGVLPGRGREPQRRRWTRSSWTSIVAVTIDGDLNAASERAGQPRAGHRPVLRQAVRQGGRPDRDQGRRSSWSSATSRSPSRRPTTAPSIVTEIDERVRRIAGIKDLQVKARKFPSIELKEAPPQPGERRLHHPKPILGVEFLSQEQGGDSRYGDRAGTARARTSRIQAGKPGGRGAGRLLLPRVRHRV